MTNATWKIVDLSESNPGPDLWAVLRGREYAAIIGSRPEYGFDFDPDGVPAVVGYSFYVVSCASPLGDIDAFWSHSLTRLLHTVIGWIELTESGELADLIDEQSHARALYHAGNRNSGLQVLDLEQQIIECALEYVDVNDRSGRVVLEG